jgi:hypothetical protein
MIYQGNLEITKNNAAKYASVTEVTGYLSVYADFKADALTSVGGYLYVDADFKADALTSVGGYLYVDADFKADALTSVGGDLSVYADFKADALTSVGGYLYVDADFKADALTSVGGYLSVDADFKADALTSVGGYLYVDADFKADALTSVGGYLSVDADFKAPNLYTPGFANFRVYDDIPCAVISKKSKDGVEIMACRKAQIKDNNIVGGRFYVAKRGDVTAHGETAKEALDELVFKTGARDVEQYRDMPLTTRKSPKQWALIYRQVTGACQYGTNDFMQRKTLKKSYTLKEIIAETKGAYGHEQFKSVVSP